MGSFGPLEIILIFLVVLLIFGAKRIPEIARGIGKGIREFKDATSEISQELEAEAQNRQINQPQSPRQGRPQARQSQEQQSPQPQQEAASESASSDGSDADASTASEEQSEKKNDSSSA